jgi:hypothetical protein
LPHSMTLPNVPDGAAWDDDGLHVCRPVSALL